MVTVGLAVTLAPVVALRPVAGLQVYVLAPLAFKAVEFPTQMEGELTVIVGVGLTVTVEVAVEVQLPVVPITVYVVVTVGLAVTILPVVPLNPVDGVQL